MANALPLEGCEDRGLEIPDISADVERLTLLRHDLRRIGEIASQLSRDQRLVLASQLSCDKDLPYGRIMELMGIITQGGFTHVALLAEQTGPAPAAVPKPARQQPRPG